MSFYGIGNGGADSFFSSFFGTSSYSGNSSSQGVSLSDWAMIKGGTYKKLMNAYYGVNKSESVSAIGEKLGLEESDKQVSIAAGDASTLVKAVDKITNLVKESIDRYDTAAEDDKSKIIDEIYAATAKYVESYNSTVKSVSELDNNSMLRNGVSMTSNTSANKKMLDKIGITVGSDNTLSIDEKKFKSANMSDISTLFGGNGSYAGHVRTSANMISKVAGYTYTNTGSYARLSGLGSSFNGKV